MRAPALAAAAALALAACVRLAPAPIPTPDASAWGAARDAASRRVELYDGFATRAFGTVTWISPEVRAERRAIVAEWRATTAEERAAAQAADEAEAARWDEFTLSFFTADRADNDLDAARTGWRIALVDATGERLVTDVQQVRADALVRTLHPSVGDFDVVYRLRFPRREGAPPLAPPFTLRLAGPRGRMDFAY